MEKTAETSNLRAAAPQTPVGERWVEVPTRQGEERTRASVQRQVAKSRAQWEKTLWHLSTQRFACEPDAQAVLDKQLKKRPAWLDVSTQLVAHPKHHRAGRPRPDATPDRQEWQITAALSVNEAALERDEVAYYYHDNPLTL